MEQGLERISSNELSKRMKLTASQIRQDLNNFGGFGQQGYGYRIQKLHDEIARILSLDEEHSMILVGAGHLGQALANYSNFQKRGFLLRAVFDVKPELIGTEVAGLRVLPMEELERVIDESGPRLAALCVPKDAALPLAERLVSLGIKGIWNFAPVDLELPEQVVVENVHLSESLMRLSYRLRELSES